MRRFFTVSVLVGIMAVAGCAGTPGPSATDPYDESPPGFLSREQLQAEPVDYELDIPYADSRNPRQRLDLYLPRERATEALPVVVYLHGGGWSQGDKADGAARLLPLVRGGEYAGVSVGYRLSGEAAWPAQLHDAKAAIRWIRANAEEYGLDASRIAVWGRSAGGHLALMVGLAGDDPALEGAVGAHPGVDTRVAGVVNQFGATNLQALLLQPSRIDRARPDAPESRLLGGPVPQRPDQARQASPVNHVSRDDPPVLTLHGTEDRIVPYQQAIGLDRALVNSGVTSYFVPVIGAGHGGFPDDAGRRIRTFLSRILLDASTRVDTSPVR